jgi:hypothetical protein
MQARGECDAITIGFGCTAPSHPGCRHDSVVRPAARICRRSFDALARHARVGKVGIQAAFAGARLARGAQAAMLKIDAVLPAELRGRAERSRVFVPQRWYEAKSGVVDALHEAIESRRVLKLEYQDADGTTSTREVEPLCLACWGSVWTLGAWCRLRVGFRNFRPDRMQFVATGEIFVETRERGLDAYLVHAGVPRQRIE